MLDVFRFAWFAVGAFVGFVLLVLTLYAAMWAFGKIDSMVTRWLISQFEPQSSRRQVSRILAFKCTQLPTVRNEA